MARLRRGGQSAASGANLRGQSKLKQLGRVPTGRRVVVAGLARVGGRGRKHPFEQWPRAARKRLCVCACVWWGVGVCVHGACCDGLTQAAAKLSNPEAADCERQRLLYAHGSRPPPASRGQAGSHRYIYISRAVRVGHARAHRPAADLVAGVVADALALAGVGRVHIPPGVGRPLVSHNRAIDADGPIESPVGARRHVAAAQRSGAVVDRRRGNAAGPAQADDVDAAADRDRFGVGALCGDVGAFIIRDLCMGCRCTCVTRSALLPDGAICCRWARARLRAPHTSAGARGRPPCRASRRSVKHVITSRL